MRHLTHVIIAALTLGGTAWAQESSAPRARVSELRISRLDDTTGRAVTQLPAGTSGVKCTLEVQGVPRGANLDLHWFRDGAELTTSPFGAVEGSSTLSANLESDPSLEPGAYRAELWIDDVPEGHVAFTIEGTPDDGQRDSADRSPRVSDVTLTTSDCPTSPPGAAETSFSGFIESVSLCLTYENMPSSRPLEVRWYHDVSPGRPMTVSTFSPSGSGELSASYLSDGPMAPGSYHVVVALGNVPLRRAAFVVEP